MKIEEYYKTNEGLIELVHQIAEMQQRREMATPNRIEAIKTFIITEVSPNYQIFFSDGMDEDRMTIYHNHGVTINICEPYGYIDVLGLTGDEIDYLGIQAGDDIALILR